MDLNSLLGIKLKEAPNLQPTANFNIVNLNLIESKKNGNIYEWKWNYIPPPNPKDAAYPGNGGWKNICCVRKMRKKKKFFYYTIYIFIFYFYLNIYIKKSEKKKKKKKKKK